MSVDLPGVHWEDY